MEPVSYNVIMLNGGVALCWTLDCSLLDVNVALCWGDCSLLDVNVALCWGAAVC